MFSFLRRLNPFSTVYRVTNNDGHFVVIKWHPLGVKHIGTYETLDEAKEAITRAKSKSTVVWEE